MPLASLPDATLVGPLGAVDDSPTRSGKAEGLAARGGPQHACSARPNGGLGSGFVVARWTAALPKAQTRPTREGSRSADIVNTCQAAPLSGHLILSAWTGVQL